MLRWLILFLIINTLNSSNLFAQQIRNNSTPKQIKKFLKGKKADKIVFSKVHQDIYQLRDKKTQKWGMYDWYNQLIPMEYDSIVPFNQFQPYTIAKNNNEYTIIQWPYDTERLVAKQLKEIEGLCIKTIEENQYKKFFLLANHNGNWGCLNWQDLSTIIPFKYASPEDVPLANIIATSTN